MPTGVYKRSKEHLKKLWQGYKNNGPYNIGKKFSDSHKEKMRIKKLGSNNNMWNGGKYINNKGYVHIYSPNHPYKDSRNYVAEHRLKMEIKIGRYLLKDEVVHHINENPSDNRIINLKLMNRGDHQRLHISMKVKRRKNETSCKRIK